MRVTCRLRAAVATREQGFSVIELAVGGLVASVLLALLATFLVSSLRTSTFAQAQSFTLDDVRIAVQRLEREIRSASNIIWCSPSDNCVQLSTDDDDDPDVMYVRSGSELTRQKFAPGSGWGPPQSVLKQIVNGTNGHPDEVFTCESTDSLLRVRVALLVQPTTTSDPENPFEVNTSVRPRNVPGATPCP